MAITVQYSDPIAIGQAALAIGQGQNIQRQEEEARRDAELALRQAAFAEQQKQAAIDNEMAAQQQAYSQYDRNRSFGYGAYQDAAGRAMQQQQLAQQAAQFGQGLQSDAARAAMQQQGRREDMQMQAARDKAQMIYQADRDRQQQMAKTAALEWDAIQKARADGKTFINDSHYQATVKRWQDKYAEMNQPMPIDLPFIDQPAIAPRLQAFYDEFELPYDEQTGESLLPPAVLTQIVQSRIQERQANVKADTTLQASQAKLEAEQAKADAKAQQAAQAEAAKVIAAAFESKAKRDAAVWGQDTYTEQVPAGEGKTTKVERTTQGYSPQMTYDQAMAISPPPLVTDPNVWALLPPGTIYRAPDGAIYTKN